MEELLSVQVCRAVHKYIYIITVISRSMVQSLCCLLTLHNGRQNRRRLTRVTRHKAAFSLISAKLVDVSNLHIMSSHSSALRHFRMRLPVVDSTRDISSLSSVISASSDRYRSVASGLPSSVGHRPAAAATCLPETWCCSTAYWMH